MRHIVDGIIKIAVYSESDYLAVNARYCFENVFILAVNYERTVIWSKKCKFPECIYYMVQITEIIKVVCLNISDNGNLREETQKALVILTCLGNKKFLTAYMCVATDNIQFTAYGNCRILTAFHKNLCKHTRSSGFSVSSADADRAVILFHNDSKHLCPVYLCDSQFLCTDTLRITFGDSGTVYHQVAVLYIVCIVTYIHSDSQ